jgi:hypothetical protein
VSAIASGDHDIAETLGLKLLSEIESEGCFAGSPRRQISNGDHRQGSPMGSMGFSVVASIPERHDESIETLKGKQEPTKPSHSLSVSAS